MPPIPVTALLRGHIDVFQPYEAHKTFLAGWIFREDIAIDTVDVSLDNQTWVQSLALFDRPDVQAAYEPHLGSCAHALHSGFSVRAELPTGVKATSNVLIGITPYTHAGLKLDTLIIYHCAYDEEVKDRPQPPVHLQDRIGGSRDFIYTAAQLASHVLTCAAKYRPISKTHRILDWGCGCGRVIAQLVKFVSPSRLFGCDIDAEAIAWDVKNIAGPSFTRIDPYPPTTYPDSYFDLIYGISVVTHLDEDTQMRWLAELERIAMPGAIIILSIIGETLRSKNMPSSLASEFTRKGFASFVPNYSALVAEFSHANYYRETYHSLDYIAARWRRHFRVLECVETKHQDLVVLQRR
jgi:SAM-dependent methyltransferase